ncbi:MULTISPECIES: ThiF family adenylyltransferase [unclassified Streptomyces]|uniref:HesA/MoeB/ThiF family protein n=1 Tax=unclassified Streptomyces TaxID=2593676 RepID=UPI00341B8825
MTAPPEDRVWARHHRRTGAVLIVGAGAVGGFLAEELARIGFSPLRLVDPDTLAVENLIRHPLGAPALGRPKALALAAKIRRDFPSCDATGHHADFLALPADEQRSLAGGADVVVAATDSAVCQRHVNRVALAVGRPAVYPAVWVDPRIRDAEVGEILWVLPGRRTPCYECAVAFRQGTADTQAARGARVDIQLVALATAQVVTALAHPDDDRSAILDHQRNAIYLHGLTPTSPGVRATFPTTGLSSRNVRVPFPSRPCAACHGWRHVTSSPALAAEGTGARPGEDGGRSWPVFAAVVLCIVVLFIVSVVHGKPM